MSLKTVVSLILFGILITEWKLTDACTCLVSHPQTLFCNSDFAAEVTPYRTYVFQGKRVYLIKIVKIYKVKQSAVYALSRGKLYTELTDGMCGVTLSLNTKYLVTGHVHANNRATVMLCDFCIPKINVTPKQLQGFETYYRMGCKCDIHVCQSWEYDCNTNPPCTMDMNNKGMCYIQYSACVPNCHHECQWTNKNWIGGCLYK